MDKIKEFLDKNYKILLLVFVILFVIDACSTNKELNQIKKTYKSSNDSLKAELIILQEKQNSLATKEEIKDMNEELMYLFLLYEEDLDKGKISLSTIKERIKK